MKTFSEYCVFDFPPSIFRSVPAPANQARQSLSAASGKQTFRQGKIEYAVSEKSKLSWLWERLPASREIK
jgi:hypothetical protein